MSHASEAFGVGIVGDGQRWPRNAPRQPDESLVVVISVHVLQNSMVVAVREGIVSVVFCTIREILCRLHLWKLLSLFRLPREVWSYG